MQYRLSTCALAALLTACGGSQPLIGVPGAMRESHPQLSNGSGYKLLYSFKGGPDGEYPGAGLVADGDLLYGTTSGNGCDSSCAPGSHGTVFDVSSSGEESVLYSFKGQPDGAIPSAALIDVSGTLYGTTQLGGTYNDGTVFDVTTSGAERVLYSFKGADDGRDPFGSLIALHRKLYGVTALGGGSGCRSLGCGTVFEVSTSGQERVVYSFKGYPRDGELPIGSLIAEKGLLYGVTWVGGRGGCNTGCGTIFELTTSGNERVIHDFKGPPDGENPAGGLASVNGLLYGTTGTGGTSNACSSFGCGTVFATTTSGEERVLYSFKGARDGEQPYGGLLLADRRLYGTAAGGAPCSPSGRCGIVFSVSTRAVERVLYRFKGHPDGAYPDSAPLADKLGVLYGTTAQGGANTFGTVFSIAP